MVDLKTPAVRFTVHEKHFENGAFRKNSRQTQTQNQNDRWLLLVQISSVDGV